MQLPPIHPAIVHFPIALIIVAFFADLFFRKSQRPSLRNFGFGCLLAALGLGVVTLIAGYYDMVRLPLTEPSHDYVHIHMYTGFALAAVLIALTFWRWRILRSSAQMVSGSYLGLGIVLLALTLFQGWYGGEMVYSQGIGVAAAEKGTESANKAQHRLAKVSKLLTGRNFQDEAVGSPGGSEKGTKSSKEHHHH